MPTRPVTYTPNRAGFAKMMVSPKVYGAVLAEAEFGKGVAEVIASADTKSGHYEASFRVEPAPPVRIAGHMRARALLMNVARYAVVREFGRKGHTGDRILGRALDAIAARGRRRRR